MLYLIVYRFQGDCYLAYFGPHMHFQSKEVILSGGGEEEVFTLTHSPKASFVDTLTELLAKLKEHGITDIKTTETIRAFHGDRRNRSNPAVQ